MHHTNVKENTVTKLACGRTFTILGKRVKPANHNGLDYGRNHVHRRNSCPLVGCIGCIEPWLVMMITSFINIHLRYRSNEAPRCGYY